MEEYENIGKTAMKNCCQYHPNNDSDREYYPIGQITADAYQHAEENQQQYH
jgi:hypothetical protein